jgi:hypothetical protein
MQESGMPWKNILKPIQKSQITIPVHLLIYDGNGLMHPISCIQDGSIISRNHGSEYR